MSEGQRHPLAPLETKATPVGVVPREKLPFWERQRRRIQDALDKPITRRRFNTVVAVGGTSTVVGATLGGIKGYQELSTTASPNIPAPESDMFRVVLSPEMAEASQGKGNFDALRAYKEDPLISYDGATNSGQVLSDEENPEVVVIALTSSKVRQGGTNGDTETIIIRRGAGTSDKDALFLTKGSKQFDEMLKKNRAAVRLLGGEYGDSKSPGRLDHSQGVGGGVKYGFVGAEDVGGVLQYHYINTEGNRLQPGDKPFCVSATFGNRVYPNNNTVSS